MIGLVILLFSLYFFYIKKYYFSLILFFLLLTNGFQFIPMNWLLAGLPLKKGFDLAIIFILVIFFDKFRYIKNILRNEPLLKYLVYFLIFIFADALYSYFFLKNTFLNVFQVFRQYLVFLIFVPFLFVPLAVLKKVFHSIALITLIQCVFFLLQIVTKSTLLYSEFGDEEVTKSLEGSYTRYYNTPAFLISIAIYFLFVYKHKWAFNKYISLGILILTIVAPLHRSSIIAFITVLLFYFSIQRGNYVYIFLLSIVVFIGSFVEVVSERINKTFIDLSYIFKTNLDLDNLYQDDNTLIFRIAHFLERFNYVLMQPIGWLFGIGLISDNSSKSQKLPFVNGLISELTGQVVQIDTGDIIYSLLILNTGVVGMLFYILIYFKFIIYFFYNFKHSKYSIIGFLVILNAFFTSMAGIEMLSLNFRVIVIFIFVMIFKQSLINKKHLL